MYFVYLLLTYYSVYCIACFKRYFPFSIYEQHYFVPGFFFYMSCMYSLIYLFKYNYKAYFIYPGSPCRYLPRKQYVYY